MEPDDAKEESEDVEQNENKDETRDEKPDAENPEGNEGDEHGFEPKVSSCQRLVILPLNFYSLA